MHRFTFVILHYLGYEDTFSCVHSLLELNSSNDIHIVVVDNNSCNGSYEKLKDDFSKVKQVVLLQNEANLGFSKGNNIGYVYAKKHLASDFICIVNNDTVFEQKEFVDKVVNLYQKHAFDVLGPDIISTRDHRHQNPLFGPEYLSFGTLLRELIANIVFLLADVFYLRKQLMKLTTSDNKVDHKHSEIVNAGLQGSCLIFSPSFIELFENAFEEYTFMYGEEYFLYLRRLKYGLKFLYSPQVSVLHHEYSSTNQVFDKPRKKRFFEYRLRIYARIICLFKIIVIRK